MKRLLIAALLSMAGFIACSQQPLLEHALPELTDNYHYERINCVTDSVHNRLYVVMLAKNTMHAIKISLPAFTVEKEVTGAIAYDDEIEDYYGATIANDTLTMLYSSRHKRVNVYTFIFDSNSFLNIPVSAENKKEKILNAFVWQNRMCFLKLIDPKSKTDRHLQVYSESQDGSFIAHDFHFSRNSQTDAGSSGGGGFSRSYGFYPSLISNDYQVIIMPAMHNRYPSLLNTTKYYIKQYCRDDEIFITEEFNGVTEVLSINLRNNTTTAHMYMKEKGSNGNQLGGFCNSFVLKDILFQINAERNQLVMNLQSLKDTTVKNIVTWTDQVNTGSPAGTFVNENRETRFPFSGKEKTLDGMKAFLAAIFGNAMAIVAEEVNNSYKVTIGALKIVRSTAGGGFNSISPGVPTEYLSSDAVYFTTWLDAATLKSIPADSLTGPGYDKVDMLFSKIDEKINKYDFFRINGLDYFCYYNQRKNKVFIVKVE